MNLKCQPTALDSGPIRWRDEEARMIDEIRPSQLHESEGVEEWPFYPKRICRRGHAFAAVRALHRS
jgi:hypothetical protein